MKSVHAYLPAVLMICLVSAASCRMMAVSSAKEAMEARLNPLLGKTKHEVLMAVGAPQEQRVIDGMEVWYYYQSYGTASSQAGIANAHGNVNTTAYTYPGGGNANTTYSGYSSGVTNGQSWEAYDRFTIYFDRDSMVKWDGYVQR